MNVYNNLVQKGAIKTEYIDPVNHNNNRTEFRLGNKGEFYMTDMCLLDVGRKAASQQDYNKLSGYYSIIKNIYLFDGKTELSSLRDAEKWLGWLNVKNTNEYNINVNKILSGNSIGLVNNFNKELNINEAAKQANTTDANTDQGILYLGDVFPILNVLTILPASVMPNLRVVIEYNSQARKVLGVDNVDLADVIQPILKVNCVNEDMGADVIKAGMSLFSQPVNWNEIEKDQFHLAAVGNDAGAQGVEHTTNHKVNGFNNKRVGNVLLVKELSNINNAFSNNDIIGFGNNGSLGWYKGKYQVDINGRCLLPRDGVTGDNERLGLLCDIWGNINAYPFCNSVEGGSQLTNAELFKTHAQLRTGQIDYVGFPIGEVVEDLQFNFKRTSLQDNTAYRPASAEMVVHIYGQVAKQLVVGNGEYNIVYL